MLTVISRNNRGFTLVEVLIAFVLMAIGLLAIWALHFTSLRVDMRNRGEAEALRYANDIIEEMRARNFTSVASETRTVESPPGSGRVFTIQCVVDPPDPSTPWRKDVTVTVTWSERVISSEADSSRDVGRTVELRTSIVRLT